MVYQEHMKRFPMSNHGLYKADIWIYAILWRHGGVYLDHECVLLEELSNIVDILTVEDSFSRL